MRRIPALIPKEQAHLALRLRRQLMAFYSYCIVAFTFALAAHQHIVAADLPIFLIFGTLLAFNSIIFVLIRSGWTSLFQDPSFTKLQVFVGILLITVLIHYGGTLRGPLLSLYFMVMMFGIFAMSRREMMGMSVAAIVCFALLYIVEATIGHHHSFQTFLGEISVLLFGSVWFVYVGGYISNLQVRIREQRESLEIAQSELSQSNRQLQSALAKLERIAIRDELTGLYNRRHLMERLNELIGMAERNRYQLHLAIIDLDHFKLVNDKYGHAAGDKVLRQFADIATQTLRRSDFIARYGGEEFVIVFNEGTPDAIMAALERLRQRFSEYKFDKIDPALTVSFSGGVSTLHANDAPDDIIQRADKVLYQAKAEGRNRITPDITA